MKTEENRFVCPIDKKMISALLKWYIGKYLAFIKYYLMFIVYRAVI